MNRVLLIFISLACTSCGAQLYQNIEPFYIYKDKLKTDSLYINSGMIWSPHYFVDSKKNNVKGITIIDTTKQVQLKRSGIKSPWMRVPVEEYYISPEQLKRVLKYSNRAVHNNRMLNTILGRKSYDLFLGWKLEPNK